MLCINKLLNHNVDIITIGTKLKNSITAFGKSNFFNKTNGTTLDNHVTTAQPIIVNII